MKHNIKSALNGCARLSFSRSLRKTFAKTFNLSSKSLQSAGIGMQRKIPRLDALYNLIARKHPAEKILVFSQFADTVRYLETELKKRGITKIAGVTGDTDDPTEIAWRF